MKTMHPINRNALGNDDFDEDDQTPAGLSRPVGRDMVRQLTRNLLGRWYWIVLGLILGLFGAAFYLTKTPRQFTATASLLIKQQTSTVMQRDQVDAIDLRGQEALNTITACITRKELLDRVATRLDIRQLVGLVPPPVDWCPLGCATKPSNPPPPTPRSGTSRHQRYSAG